MARRQSIPIRQDLTSLIGSRRLHWIAEEAGAVQRRRKVSIVHLFWTLVLGFGTGKERSFSGLRRMYELASGTRIVPSSFWDRFTPQLTRFLKQVTVELLEKVGEPRRAPGGVLDGFRDLVIADATVIRLHHLLARKFPGTRTKSSPAAGKVHMVMSAFAAGPRTVKISSERTNERRKLPVGPWLRDRLLLLDLGYYHFQLFDCINRNGGYFISRLKKRANPRIVSLHRRHRGRAIKLEGHTLQEVLPHLKRQQIDAQVEISFKRRIYRGSRTTKTRTFRMVGVLNEDTGEYHLYLTNVPPERLDPEEISSAYRCRWHIELLFQELKSGYGLDQLPSSKKCAVEAFIYASIITLIASRRLLLAVRRRLRDQADRVGHMRWARIFRAFAQEILQILILPPRLTVDARRRLGPCLLHEALDPHLARPGLIRQVENGTAW